MNKGRIIPGKLMKLDDKFLDWWYAPWKNCARPVPWAAGLGEFALRDGYRHWCNQAGVTPAMPAEFDAGWCELAALSAPAVLATARLYAGMLLHDQPGHVALRQLTIDQKRWCFGIGAIQPVRLLSHDNVATLEEIGLHEIAHWLEHGFPGFWPRLRLSLPAMFDDMHPCQTDLINMQSLSSRSVRARRCVLLCSQRASTVEMEKQGHLV